MDAGSIYGNVSGRMVCRIHVESDVGHPYDPYTEVTFYSEQSIGSCNMYDLCRYSSFDSNTFYSFWYDVGIYRIASCVFCIFDDSNTFYSFWYDVGIYRIASCVFCIFDSMYFGIYDVGDEYKKSLCKTLWGTALS